jgi:CheY-like chemotaxis protein
MDRRHFLNRPTRPLVLLAEDHEDSRAMYALALLATGFEVVAVPDSAEAEL